jgi:hypothetical protein
LKIQNAKKSDFKEAKAIVEKKREVAEISAHVDEIRKEKKKRN